MLAAIVVLFAVPGRADATAYAQIIKERNAVLSKILAEQESRYAMGLVDNDAIARAQLALYSFRRDVAPTNAEKIKNQELVVQVHEKRQALVQAQVKSGLGGPIEVLLATDDLLRAKQALEELKLTEKK
jgi:hypothetical protein